MAVTLRGWELFEGEETPVVGAAVNCYVAHATHPNPNSSAGSTTTSSQGKWEFTGLADAAYDVKVVYGGQTKWYKGLTSLSASIVNNPVQRCAVHLPSSQAVADVTDVAMSFGASSEDFDNDTMHDTSTNPTRITFTTAGVYAIRGEVQWQDNVTGSRQVWIRKNGTTVLCADRRMTVTSAGLNTNMGCGGLFNFAAADYVELFARQNSGISLNAEANTTFLHAWRVY